MPLIDEYRYAILVCKGSAATVGSLPGRGSGKSAHVLGQVPVEVDWDPAVEWARFLALRHRAAAIAAGDADGSAGEMPEAEPGGKMPAGEAPASSSVPSITPIWDTQAGEPYTRGFRVTLAGGTPASITTDFATDYFNRLAGDVSAKFVETGELEEGDPYVYMALAFPGAPTPEDTVKPVFSTEETRTSLPLRAGCLASFRERGGRNQASAAENSEDHPVFVSRRVLTEAQEIARQADGREAGGVLIGHLRRDTESGDVFAEVTAQIPARHTEADSVSLTFTPDTWSDVRGALALRGRGETMLGWFHSHPVREWCKKCSVESQKRCRLARDFFSSQDELLHRTVFSPAQSVALVVNDAAFADGMSFSMFGWRRGLIQPRGFQSINGTARRK